MKTGLVLEGGAIRTVFSCGVCDAFLDADIAADYVIGVSAGIAYGVSYVSKQKERNLEILTKYVNDKRYMGKRHMLNPFNRAYFNLKFTYDTIPNELIPFDYNAFAAFPGEVEAVVTNLDTGGPEYLPVSRHDDKFLLLQATCAMPLLFPTYHLNGMPCLDGGASDAIPFQRALDKGCDKLIVILTRERAFERKDESLQRLIDIRYRKYPNFCDTMRHRAGRYNAARARLFESEADGSAFVFAPKDTGAFSRTERDVEKIRALYRDGYGQATARMEELKAFINS